MGQQSTDRPIDQQIDHQIKRSSDHAIDHQLTTSQDHKIRVCVVIPSLAGGGAERVAVTVLSALDASQYERVLYLFSGEGVYFDRIAPGIQVVVAKQQSWQARMRELAAFLRAFRPDVVMPFLSYFITATAARLARSHARVVFNQGTPTSGFLNDPDFSWKSPARRRLFAATTRFFYKRADAVVVTSKGVGDDLVARYQVPRKKIRVLHNPVDLEAIAKAATQSIANDVPPPARPVIVSAGRLAAVKNYPLLIDAIADLSTRTPVDAWILGDGDERERLERRVSGKGLKGAVLFLGFQTNPWRFIARASVFVLTSTYEGFGNVLVEAMACGVPVVATRSPGTIEIIEDGHNGLLVDHDAKSVAAAIERVIRDIGLRQRLVSQARASVEHYAVPRVAERYDQMFRELIAS
jgi:glycosyltransferase involved in cell wall biosynthesis